MIRANKQPTALDTIVLLLESGDLRGAERLLDAAQRSIDAGGVKPPGWDTWAPLMRERINMMREIAGSANVEALYGTMIFWQLHGDGYRDPRFIKAERAFEAATAGKAFYGGRAVQDIPGAKKAYLALAQKHGVTPKAVASNGA